MGFKSDIEIAQETPMLHIREIDVRFESHC